MAVPKGSSQAFSWHDDARRDWQLFKTSLGRKGNDMVPKAPITVGCPWCGCQMKMQNHWVFEPKPLQASTEPAKAQEVYSSYTTSSSKAKPTATPDLDQIDDLDLEEMDINWQIAMTAIKIKKFYKKTGRRPRVDGKMHVAFDKRKVECQINWVEQTTDEELNHALMAFTVNNEVSMCSKLCLDSYNALQAKYDELQSEFDNQEAALVAHKIAVKKETNAGYNDIPLYSRFKQVEYKGVPHPLSGDYTPREQEDIDDSLYEYGKYGPQPQSPSPIESDASFTVFSTCQSNDSDGEQGTVSDHSVNDDPIPIPSSEQVSTSIQKTQPQVPKPQQTVDPSCAQHVKTPRQQIRTPVTPSPIHSYNRQNWNQRMERELGAGYSFERKPCFVCGSLSHLIKDCDYYEKKMAREAALKSKKVVHADSGGSRFNTGHGNVNSGRVHVNTARVNRPILSNQTSQVNLKSPKKCFSKQSSPVNRPCSRHTAYKSNIYAVKGKMGTAVKTSAGCVWRKAIPLSNINSGPTPDSNVNVSRGPILKIIKNYPKWDLLLLEEVKVVSVEKEELLQFKLQQVWVLVDLPNGAKVIGTKWVYRNKKDERGVVVRNKARLVAQGHRQEEGIDYDEVFAPVARYSITSFGIAMRRS
ncbi:ribonuclease H-like domain-containing protein [Tanacetum coccineum]